MTSRRLYLETLEGIMQGMNKVLIDTGGNGNGGPVPYLPLDQLLRQQKGAAQPVPQSSATPVEPPAGSAASSTGTN